jgi:hypothetical protein
MKRFVGRLVCGLDATVADRPQPAAAVQHPKQPFKGARYRLVVEWAHACQYGFESCGFGSSRAVLVINSSQDGIVRSTTVGPQTNG